MNQLSENLKYLRETAKLTQGAFGKAFGVSRDNIASYERGSAPKIDFLKKIVNFYHMSMDVIVNENLKDMCESKKLDLKIRPNLDPNQTQIIKKLDEIPLNPVCTEPFPSDGGNGCKNCYKMEVKYFEAREYLLAKESENKELIAANAVLQHENGQLREELAECNKRLKKPA